MLFIYCIGFSLRQSVCVEDYDGKDLSNIKVIMLGNKGEAFGNCGQYGASDEKGETR